MSKPVVFVIGATGNIGTASLKALSAKHADKVEIRAGVRNPEKAEHLKSLAGVSVVKAAMGSSDLETTLKGVNTLFIVTPPTENCAQLVLSTAQSAKVAGVGHLLVIILPPEVQKLGNTFSKVYGTLNDDIRALGVNFTFLHLTFFYENNFAFIATVKSSNAIYYPVDPTKKFSSVAVSDAGNMAATILVDPAKHAGKSYTAVSGAYSYGDLAKVLGEALNTTITYTRVPYEETEKTLLGLGSPKWQVEALTETMKLIDEELPGILFNDDDYRTVTGEEPTSLETWISRVKTAFE